jgi:hypothetical protein
MEPMILIYARRYGEAHEAIRRQRQFSGLTIQRKQWLDTMERALDEHESGARITR